VRSDREFIVGASRKALHGEEYLAHLRHTALVEFY
jgi:hypothetical protein